MEKSKFRLQNLKDSATNLTICLILFFILISSLTEKIYGSPDFGPQVIIGNPEDQQNRENKKIEGIGYTDIMGVSYHSDGNMLYATFRVNEKLNDKPETNPTYLILVDADFNQETGINGIDFGSKIFFNDGKWQKQILEWSSTKSTTPKLFERIIESSQIQSSEIISEDGQHISHSLDFKKIGSPEKYTLIFSTYDKGSFDEVFDYSDWIVIPKPEFKFEQISEILSIRQGDKKNFEIRITGNPPGAYAAFFSSSGDTNVKLKFPSDKITLEPFGILEVETEVDENALVGIRNLKIISQINPIIESKDITPQSEDNNSGSLNDISVDPTLLQNKLQDFDIPVPFSIGKITNPYTTEPFSVMIEIQPALTVGEEIEIALNPWENPINLFTVIASLLGGLFLWIWQHRAKIIKT